jgi:hypothetical protein
MRSPIFQCIFATLLITAAVSASLASELGDYQRRVDSARAGIGVLLENASQMERGEAPTQPEAEVFAELRRLIPNSEKVDAANGTIETNNLWFAEGLKAAETETDLAKRSSILSELEQRLGAVSTKLDELQVMSNAERSKDEDKRKLSEILSRPEFQRPVKEPEENSQDAAWIKRFLEWLESFFPKFSPPEGAAEGASAFAGLLQWILIIAVILVLGFVLYKLLPLFAPRLRRAVREEREDRVILGERIGEDQSADDLFSEAERLAREGDIRGAIRKGYVALLCEMSDRKLIGLARHKTNRDYLRDVRSRREVYEKMNGLTGKFERHWYGSQLAVPDDWEEFRQNCGETLKAI